MSAREIHVFACEVRRAHAVVAAGELRLFRELLQFLDEHRATRQPQRQAGAHVVVEREKLQLLAELAMVALLRLLEHREILVHLRLVLERRAVDALELRVFLVALVVGARDVRELERADVPRAHDVRPGAQIEEVAIAEERDFLALGDVREIADFEFARIPRPLAEPAEAPAFRQRHRLRARHRRALEDVVRLDLLFHLLLDAREVLRRDAVLQIHVVVKAILHRRPRGKLRLRPDAEDGRGEHMRRAVAQPLNVGHLVSLLDGLAFVGHNKRAAKLGARARLRKNADDGIGRNFNHRAHGERGAAKSSAVQLPSSFGVWRLVFGPPQVPPVSGNPLIRRKAAARGQPPNSKLPTTNTKRGCRHGYVAACRDRAGC